jgi:hypothetical protein
VLPGQRVHVAGKLVSFFIVDDAGGYGSDDDDDDSHIKSQMRTSFVEFKPLSPTHKYLYLYLYLYLFSHSTLVDILSVGQGDSYSTTFIHPLQKEGHRCIKRASI